MGCTAVGVGYIVVGEGCIVVGEGCIAAGEDCTAAAVGVDCIAICTARNRERCTEEVGCS